MTRDAPSTHFGETDSDPQSPQPIEWSPLSGEQRQALLDWVRQRPLLLIRFDDVDSEALINATTWREQLTIARSHTDFLNITFPTPILLQTTGSGGDECYLGIGLRKKAVSTLQSRITIRKLRRVMPSTFAELTYLVTRKTFRRTLEQRLPSDSRPQILSPELSVHILERLAEKSCNAAALLTAWGLIPGLRKKCGMEWAQDNAIQTALRAFGIGGSASPLSVVVRKGRYSGLRELGDHLYEDNVIRFDTTQVSGFNAISNEINGRAVFRNGNERLTIYTANKLPLEQAFGVDLIYINETRCSIVMLQYKMLEPVEKNGVPSDWVYRPDRQLQKEIERMKLPSPTGEPKDYRMHKCPYFFKFVKRRLYCDSPKCFIISLDHLQQLLGNPQRSGAVGMRKGIRISHDVLDGTYLREQDLIGLMRSGYIGTHRVATQPLQIIIDAIAKGNRAAVLAWQSKRAENSMSAVDSDEIADRQF